jgi:hypothetical protein
VQRYVVEQSGTAVRHCYVAHIDKDYVRSGEIDNFKLFRIVEVTDEVAERLVHVPARVAALAAVIEQPVSPEVPIGSHCSSPYDCPLKPVCWGALPEEHVTRLVGGGKRKYELVAQGMAAMTDIPTDFELNDRQAIQVAAARSRQTHVDAPNVQGFLGQLAYPLFFLDFVDVPRCRHRATERSRSPLYLRGPLR